MRKTDNLPSYCAVVTKSGSLNFLEPSGPVQACNGTALFLPLMYSVQFQFAVLLPGISGSFKYASFKMMMMMRRRRRRMMMMMTMMMKI